MRRKLTPREWMLLAVLGVLVLVSGYILLFYMPVTTARDTAIAETETTNQQIEAARLRLEDKLRMERELEEIFAEDPNPLGLADYDNVQPVMRELHTVLAPTEDYSLNFATVEVTDRVVRRSISISFTCDGYSTAKSVLQQLNNSLYRCMLNDISISVGRTLDGRTFVNGSIVYFELQA